MTANRVVDLYSDLANRPIGTLIYRPGYTGTADDVKTTWSEVKEVIEASGGGLNVIIDNSSGSCVVTETTNCFGKTSFTGAGSNPQLSIADGVQLIDPVGVVGVQISGAPTIVSSILMTIGGSIVAERGGGYFFEAGATLPLIKSEASFAVFARYLNGGYGTDQAPTVPLITVATGSTSILASIDCGLIAAEPNPLIDGDPTSILILAGDANSFFVDQTLFLGTKIQQRTDKSSGLLWSNGDTASRPTNAVVGQSYFDTDLNTNIWWDGATWTTSLVLPDIITTTVSNPGNDTNDIAVLTTSIPANTLLENSIYEFDLAGRTDNVASASDIDWWVKINGTKVATVTFTSSAGADTNLPWSMKARISFRNLGATADGLARIGVCSFIDGSTAKEGIANNFAAPASVDTTAAVTITAGFSWQDADPANIAYADEGTIQKIR